MGDEDAGEGDPATAGAKQDKSVGEEEESKKATGEDDVDQGVCEEKLANWDMRIMSWRWRSRTARVRLKSVAGTIERRDVNR